MDFAVLEKAKPESELSDDNYCHCVVQLRGSGCPLIDPWAPLRD
jgi:hypothetical protein